ncbi:probable cytochrome P450 6d2 [Drosophila guanche]|uniref:Blast:Probable cytochrome P450 6d2 n=1 Tax=Drosophila guanche TaxID=7266 RepID=A0A3B0IYJ7_DROGU|nr:probable cytochrome P450 6d2 [Drosophila guanche]SPP72867.1 blast:Probable cytochrome P450 6d2 [Drosophila guanche]
MWAVVLALLSLVVGLLYQCVRRHYSSWQRLGVDEEPAKIPMGILDTVMKQERSLGMALSDIYKRHTGKLVGIYLINKRSILVRDAVLARQIMTSDFASFHDRGVYVDEKNDPLSANLFNLRGASWRNLRNKLTPSFSSGKIKGMFATIDDVGDKLVQHLKGVLEEAGPNSEVEMKELMTTYAVDIIGSVIFGLEIDSFSNPNNEFRAISSEEASSKSLLLKIHNMAMFICPPIAKLMNRLGYESSILTALRDMMTRTIEFRERNNVVRKDLLQLLIRLRNTGKIGEDDDEVWDIETAQEELKAMSIEKIAAQAFLFYVAGSESTAAAAAFTLYELAMYPDLLKEARDELDAVVQRHNLRRTDKLTYEAVQDLKFLDLCLMETLRKYPGLPFLNRECTEDYAVPGTSHTITQGTPILISLFGIHRDPVYFPNPEGYDPHRFDASNMNYNQAAYMPFGEGPRHCIALRMGKVNSKVAVAKILANFDLVQAPRKEVEFRFDAAPVMVPKEGLKLRLTIRK